MQIIGIIIASILFLLGLLGTVIPLLPGAPIIWFGMLIYGFITNFMFLSWKFLLFQGIIVLIILLIDYISGAWGAERYGGSRASIYGSILGGFLGIFLFGPLGIVLGPFIGAILMELLKGQSFEKSLQIGWGTIIGFFGGTLLKFVLEIIMIVWFFIQIL